jgi:homoserine O-acetyltransferase/O-succinyltransferase
MVSIPSESQPVHPCSSFTSQESLTLTSGQMLPSFTIAYTTYGTLNAQKSNAILICHALTGDQYVASPNPSTGKEGWWRTLIGSGLPLDTDRFFVICSNVLGGCMGSTGPQSINPDTGKPWGTTFPVITIEDMVKAQERLLTHLDIEKILCVIGGSMGGMQALQWAASFPHKVHSVLAMATTSRSSAQNIAFSEVGRQAIMADPHWREGNYMTEGVFPVKGLSVARMTAHITYVSEGALHRKFGRTLQDREKFSFGFDSDFQVESYLRHQGNSFVERFDANSYLYITRAVDYFDLAQAHGDNLGNAFAKAVDTRFCIISFSSDWLYPPTEGRRIVRGLNAVSANVSYVEIETDKGHDAFLLKDPHLEAAIKGFITSVSEEYTSQNP